MAAADFQPTKFVLNTRLDASTSIVLASADSPSPAEDMTPTVRSLRREIKVSQVASAAESAR